MEFDLKAGDPSKQRTACLVLGVYAKRRLPAVTQSVNQASRAFISRILKNGDLEGKVGQSLMLYEVPGTLSKRILLVGCGAEKEFNPTVYRKVIAAAVAGLNAGGATEAIL